jgi:hypothetical protein
LDRDFGDRDFTAHTHIDVMAGESRAGVEVADPVEFTASVLELESVGTRVDGAKDELVLGGLIRGVGKVDVPEVARTWGAIEEGIEGWASASGGGSPVGCSMTSDVLRDRDGRKAEDGGLSGGGGGARDMNVDAEVGPVVNTGDEPDRLAVSEVIAGEGAASTEGNASAIRRGSGEGEVPRLEFF